MRYTDVHSLYDNFVCYDQEMDKSPVAAMWLSDVGTDPYVSLHLLAMPRPFQGM